MHRGLFVVIMILGFLGCSRFSDSCQDIEFMSYHWSSHGQIPWYINYHIYAFIDKTGQGNISIHRKGKNEYYKIKIDEKFIKQVISSSESFIADSKLSYEKIVEGKMDEPDLKLRINKAGMNNRVISYMETDRFVSIKDFVKLYRYIDSLYMAGNFTKVDDTLEISRRRDDFIMEAMRIDSIISPPPPPPSLEQKRINH